MASVVFAADTVEDRPGSDVESENSGECDSGTDEEYVYYSSSSDDDPNGDADHVAAAPSAPAPSLSLLHQTTLGMASQANLILPYAAKETIFQNTMNRVAYIIDGPYWTWSVESPACIVFNFKDVLSFRWTDVGFPSKPPAVDLISGAGHVDIRRIICLPKILQPSLWNICTNLEEYFHHLDVKFRYETELSKLQKQSLSPSDSALFDLFRLTETYYDFDKENGALPTFGSVKDVEEKTKLNKPPKRPKGTGYSYSGSTMTQTYIPRSRKVFELMEQMVETLSTNLNDHPDRLFLKQIVTDLSEGMDRLLLSEEQETLLEQWEKMFGLTTATQKVVAAAGPAAGSSAQGGAAAELKIDQLRTVEKFTSHAFLKEAAPTKVDRKWVRRVTREVAVLRESLPSDVYLLWSESQMHLMKALISPADDTPYAGGYFEFDIFIGSAYPSVPPKVKTMTTGGGSIRFNPNLYQCGKVCLSLLGTWQGETWNPAQSTLLQVLVSIQAFIFVKHPYFNEPGYTLCQGQAEHDRRSEEYSERVRRDTARAAMKIPPVFQPFFSAKKGSS